MSEDNRGAAMDEPTRLRATLAFRRATPSAASRYVSAALAEAAADEPDDERMMLLSRLGEKSRKLLQGEGVLQGLYDSSTDGQERRQLDLQMDEAWAERQICDSRFRAIANNGPFANPGPQADQDLLDAIQAVELGHPEHGRGRGAACRGPRPGAGVPRQRDLDGPPANSRK